MSFANVSHSDDTELPETGDYDCPPDCISLIEEYHQGLHTISISKQTGRGKYKPIGKITCQKKGDRQSRPEANPDELAEYIMRWIQHEIDETDDPGNYRFILHGPPGKGRFNKAKHVDLRDADGIARSKDMLNEGDMLEQQSAYIGELHSQLSGMVDLVLGSYKVVVGENREMMKILSEATRKHGEIEANRLTHQLNLKIHEDEVAAQDSEAERSMQKFREGLGVFKDTNAAEELIRAVAKKIKGREEAKAKEAAANDAPRTPTAAVATPVRAVVPVDTEVEEKPKPKARKARFKKEEEAEKPEKTKKAKKTAKAKKTTKAKKAKKAKKGSKVKEEPEEEPEVEEEEEEVISDELLEEGRRMITERPLVTAAEALKMSINEKAQWGVIRKTLSEEQADILDAIFAATTDEGVMENAQRLYDAKGVFNLAALKEHLDEQQEAFIGFVMQNVEV